MVHCVLGGGVGPIMLITTVSIFIAVRTAAAGWGELTELKQSAVRRVTDQ